MMPSPCRDLGDRVTDVRQEDVRPVMRADILNALTRIRPSLSAEVVSNMHCSAMQHPPPPPLIFVFAYNVLLSHTITRNSKALKSGTTATAFEHDVN